MQKHAYPLQIGVYRRDKTVYFSFLGERKVPKESPLKESTQVLSLRILSPVLRCPFCPSAKRLMRCHFTGSRMSATSAERRARGISPFAGMIRWNFSFFSAPRACSARTALRRSCGVSGVLDLSRIQPPSPARGEGGGRWTVGCVREAVPPLRGALLVLFSRQGEKSTQINLPDKPKFIIYKNPPLAIGRTAEGGLTYPPERNRGSGRGARCTKHPQERPRYR